VAYQVNAASVEWNPTAGRLRELTEQMPNSRVTEFGNVVVTARVDSRSTRSSPSADGGAGVPFSAAPMLTFRYGGATLC
jgi:hypothetical protein